MLVNGLMTTYDMIGWQLHELQTIEFVYVNKAGYTALGAPKHLYKRSRYGPTDERRTNGWTEGRTDRWTDGRTDGHTLL